MAKRYLGYGYTNAQGVAKLEYDPSGNALSHSYTGVGAGKVDIVAESGTLQSETYSITDALYYDKAIQSEYNNTPYSSTSYLTRNENNTKIDGNGTRVRFGSNQALTGSGYTIKFHNYNSDSTSYIILQTGSNQNAKTFSTCGITGDNDVTITLTDTQMVVECGTSTKTISLSNSISGAWDFRFGTASGGSEIYYSDLMIYVS